MAAAQDTDRSVINKKIVVAANFTTALNTAQRELAYSGLDANVVIRNLLATVNLSTDTTAFQSNIDATLTTLVSQLGAQGMYSGRLTGGGNLYNSLVLENGQYWGFYASGGSAVVQPASFLQGNGTASRGVFTAPDA